MVSKSSTRQDEEAKTEKVPGSIVVYTEKRINIFNRDVTSSMLSLGLLISFSFAAKDVKGVYHVPSSAKDLEI